MCVSPRIDRNLAGKEHASLESSRPPVPWPRHPWSFAKFRGRPVLGYASHWVLGPRCSATQTSRGYSQKVLSTLGDSQCWPPSPSATARNYTNYNGHQQLHQPAKPHRHKHHPITRRHECGPCKCMFLLASHGHTHPLTDPCSCECEGTTGRLRRNELTVCKAHTESKMHLILGVECFGLQGCGRLRGQRLSLRKVI